MRHIINLLLLAIWIGCLYAFIPAEYRVLAAAVSALYAFPVGFGLARLARQVAQDREAYRSKGFAGTQSPQGAHRGYSLMLAEAFTPGVNLLLVLQRRR